MSGLRLVFVTVLCSALSSVVLMAIYSEAVDLPMPASAWLFTALAPILVSTPVSLYLVRQSERVRLLNDDLHVAYERLSRLAATDDLTGIANRRSFMETASALRRPGAWLLLADIDHFKSVNDRFGHERGDAFLQSFSLVLRDAAGPDNVVGRLGGEEFAILLRQAAQSDAVRIAETIRERIAALVLKSDDGRAISTTLSIGLVACREGSLQDDFKRADTALYRAKGRGRNQVQMHHAAKQDEALALAS